MRVIAQTAATSNTINTLNKLDKHVKQIRACFDIPCHASLVNYNFYSYLITLICKIKMFGVFMETF